MKVDELFNQKDIVASKLQNCIRDKGYTKFSFAQKTGISQSDIERLLNGSIDSKKTFDYNIQIILKSLNMTIEDIMSYSVKQSKVVEMDCFSNGTNNKTEEYDLLMDIIDLCSVYY